MNSDYHHGGPGTKYDVEQSARRITQAQHTSRVIMSEISTLLSTSVPVVDTSTLRKCYRYILPGELKCHHCGMYPPTGLALELVERWVWLRTMYGRPISITSAYRCPDHPVEREKPTPGDHTLGVALDLAIYDDPRYLLFVQIAFYGCHVLLAGDHVHVTSRPGCMAAHP